MLLSTRVVSSRCHHDPVASCDARDRPFLPAIITAARSLCVLYLAGMQARLSVAVAALTATIVVLGPTAIPRAADRPTVAGPNGAVSAGHPLTSAAAFEVLLKGGNAFDAGVAAMLVGGVVEQDLYSLGGEGAGPRLSTAGAQGHLDRRTRLGAERGDDRLVHEPRQEPERRSASIPRSFRARCTRRSPCSSAGGR